MNNKRIRHKLTHISYHLGIISCCGVQNTAMRIYLGGDEFFNIRVKVIFVLVISAQTIYNTAWQIVEIKFRLKWRKEITVIRYRSRTAEPSKMEHFVIIVNRWKPLTIITKCSILDVATVLDHHWWRYFTNYSSNRQLGTTKFLYFWNQRLNLENLDEQRRLVKM